MIEVLNLTNKSYDIERIKLLYITLIEYSRSLKSFFVEGCHTKTNQFISSYTNHKNGKNLGYDWLSKCKSWWIRNLESTTPQNKKYFYNQNQDKAWEDYKDQVYEAAVSFLSEKFNVFIHFDHERGSYDDLSGALIIANNKEQFHDFNDDSRKYGYEAAKRKWNQK